MAKKSSTWETSGFCCDVFFSAKNIWVKGESSTMGTWRLKQKNALEKKERRAVHEVCYYITYSYIYIYILYVRI